MKKNLSIIVIVLAIIAIASVIYHELHIEFTEKLLKKKLEANMPKDSGPSNYCLITYKVSTDNEKTWHEVVINSGQKPIYKAECWKKYIHILDGFNASTTHDGKWYSKKKITKLSTTLLCTFLMSHLKSLSKTP